MKLKLMMFIKIYFKIKKLFDNSTYPKNSEFFLDENKTVIGKMKDEAAGMPIKEFIGLRSRMYSYHKSFSKIEGLTEDTIEDIKKCETLKECTINKITKLRSGSVFDESIFEEIDRCKKKEKTKQKKKKKKKKNTKKDTKDQVKKCFIHESK